jgi:ABC-2 type transport system ATP-binding protein
VIRIRDLSRRYGERVALDGVSLEVTAGEIVGLLGANGAGKSTLMRTAAGLQLPDSGSIEVAGLDLIREPIESRRRLGYAAEEPALYDELSPREHLAFLAGARMLDPDPTRRRAEELLERLGLADRADEPAERLSHGMRKKLAFVAAVLHRPQVLLCDEALEGLDAEAALAAREELRALAAGGAAVLFSSHVTPVLERLCGRVVLLHRGRVVRSLDRADWGGEERETSPLERTFLDVIRTSPSPETV